jgi:hypothetical protein
MTLLVAGYDTTKSALCWSIYYLSQYLFFVYKRNKSIKFIITFYPKRNKNELEKLQTEVDRELKGRTATLDDVPNLPKCKNAVLVLFSSLLYFILLLIFFFF